MSPVGMKQMSWLSGLAATRQPALGGLRPDRAFGVSPTGNIACCSCSAESAPRARRTGPCRRPRRGAAPPAVHVTAGVVPGAHRVEAERQRLVQQRGELDLLVAAQARVRGAAGGVVLDEVVDDLLGEARRRSPTRRTGCPARRRPGARPRRPPSSSSRGTRCAARRASQTAPGARRRRRARPRPPARPPPRSRPRRSSRRGHASPVTAHRGAVALARRLPAYPARRARSTTGPIALATSATSAAVEVWPREKRSEPRAVASSAPIASSTWLGWATPAVHADPVEHSMPCASISMIRLSPSQPGNDRCALPGSRAGPPPTGSHPLSPLRSRPAPRRAPG